LDGATNGNWLGGTNQNLIQTRINAAGVVSANRLAALEDFAGAANGTAKKVAWDTVNTANQAAQRVLAQTQAVEFSLADFRAQRSHEHSETRIARE
jgi:hypothetical protein